MDNKKLMRDIGLDFLAGMRKKLDSGGMGERSNELKLVLGSTTFHVEVSNAIWFANFGRKPGKQPRKQHILPWMKKNSIDEKWVYPICRKIGRDGTKGKNFFGDLEDLTNKAASRIADVVTNKIEEGIDDNIR